MARPPQPPTDPREDGHAHGISDELKPMTSTTSAGFLFRGDGPIGWEALKAFAVADVGKDEPLLAAQPDGRLRGNANGRATLQCRNPIDGPSESAHTLGPIEPTGDATVVRPAPWLRFVDEEDSPGICRPRSEQNYSATALRQPERPRVDDPIGPIVTELDEPVGEMVHCPTSVEVEHEGDVFDEYPFEPPSVGDEPEHMLDQSRPGSPNSGRLPRLAEVLTGKSAGDQVDPCRQPAQASNVAHQSHTREFRPQHGPSERLHLAKHYDPMALHVKA